MRIGKLRAYLRARIKKLVVRPGLDVGRLERLREARPACAGIVLVERAEQRLAGYDVHVNPGLVIVPVLVVKRRLGVIVPRHGVLNGRQLLLQLGIGWALPRRRSD